MILAALLGHGLDVGAVRETLLSLGIGDFEIRAESVSESGLAGTRVNVVLPNVANEPHRGLREIRRLLDGSRLPERARTLSVAVFERLAEAEARVHNTTPDKIHFHEVGARDSLVDIAGSCLCLDLLGIEEVSVGPLPLGSGTITCAHGVLPNPAPATVEILQGHPVTQTEERCELVTPTGAALLTTWKERLPHGGGACAIRGSSQAFGHARLEGRPNLLRATILEREAQTGGDTCLVLECNLDDMTPEMVGAATEGLFRKGALDVFVTPVQMKKQRPGILLSVLCRPADRAAMLDALFRETTTFGIREYPVARTVLERRSVEVETAYGLVRVKIGARQGSDVTRAPEYEDCARRAAEHGVPVRVVYEAALQAAERL